MAYNRIYTVIGARSQGKTPFILGGEYEQGLASIYLKKGMSVLIIDELDHPKYRHVPILQPDKYYLLSESPGIYRTLCTMQNFHFLFPKLLDVWNTLIVFEDCYKYIPMKLNKDTIAIIGNSKNQNNCLVFMHWCWGYVQPDILRMTNFYIIFKTGDTPECRKTYIQGCYDLVINAWLTVSKGIKGKKPYVIVDSGI